MLAVGGDDDVHGAGEASELGGAGARDDYDVELRGAVGHSGVVLEDKGSGAAMERAGDAFDGDVAAGGFGIAGVEHFAFAGGFEVAVKLFVDGHAADGVVVGFERGIQGSEFYIEWSGSMLGHGGVLLLWI